MNINKGFIISLLVLTAGIFGFLTTQAAETPSQIAARSSQLLQRASGIKADFTLEAEGRNMKGTLKSQGKKFAITTSGTSIWYDGKTMWTYNASTGETTITIPTPQEVAETNPMSLMQANADSFKAYFAKKQPAKGKRLVLLPKTKDMGIKSVAVSVNTGSYMPYNMVVTPVSGKPTTVHITGLSTKSNFSASDFVYPSKKYPKAEIVDLR